MERNISPSVKGYELDLKFLSSLFSTRVLYKHNAEI